MTQTTKWEKQELLKVLNAQRSILRCALQHKLTAKAKKLTKVISNDIEVLQKEKYDILEQNDLGNLVGSTYGCDIVPLNQELKTFDENTNIERKNILQR